MNMQQKRQQIIAQLVEARLEKGMTQEQLAKLLGTQRSNVCRLESGMQNPTLDMILKIASALDKEIHFYLEDKKEPANKNYSLRLYDTELLQFSLEKRGLSGLVAELLFVDDSLSHLMPMDLECTNEGILQWIKRRILPKNRTFSEEILKCLGLCHHDTQRIIDVSKGLSLNDSYWIVPCGFDGRFSEYSLYDNPYSESLSLAAFTGITTDCQTFTGSPELTTGGTLPKSWHYVPDCQIYLYKGGCSSTGHEPYCAYYAAQIAETMRLNSVSYELEERQGIVAAKCALFTDRDTAYLPAGSIIKTGGIAACLEYFENLGGMFAEQLRSMLVFDALICNEDRTLESFGVLRDNHTGNIIAPAPIFGNSISLFCHAGPDDLQNLEEYAKTRSNPYNLPYEEVCAEVMGARQKEQLRRMTGFKFIRHSTINLPENHLKTLEKFLEMRVRRLLSIPIHSRTL